MVVAKICQIITCEGFVFIFMPFQWLLDDGDSHFFRLLGPLPHPLPPRFLTERANSEAIDPATSLFYTLTLWIAFPARRPTLRTLDSQQCASQTNFSFNCAPVYVEFSAPTSFSFFTSDGDKLENSLQIVMMFMPSFYIKLGIDVLCWRLVVENVSSPFASYKAERNKGCCSVKVSLEL